MILDCVSVEGVEIGLVYVFDFKDVFKEIIWVGSVYEVEMLYILRFMEFLGDLFKIFIVGFVFFVIGSEIIFKFLSKILNVLEIVLKVIEI